MAASKKFSYGPRFLDVRVDPIASSIGLIAAGLFFGVPGLWFLVKLFTSLRSLESLRQLWSVAGAVVLALAIGFTLVGSLASWHGWRALATRVRLSLDGEQWVVEWMRGNEVTKKEVVPKSDLVDVFVHDEPGSENGRVYAIALGRKEGYLMLSTIQSGMQLKFYQRQRDSIAKFLGVPARPS